MIWLALNGTCGTLAVSPLQGPPAVVAHATLRSLTGLGQYTSTLALQRQGSRTVATYDVGITATIPKPVRLRLECHPTDAVR